MMYLVASIGNISNECFILFKKFKSLQITRNELFSNIKNLVRMNHYLLGCCGMNHKSIERIHMMASDYNLSSKLTGAGEGGFVLTFLEKKKMLMILQN